MSALPAPQDLPASPPPRLVVSKVFVHALRIDAQIGIYRREEGRTQPLIIDVELDVAPSLGERLEDTVNYETLRTAANAVAAEGHIALVETFAWRLAERAFADPRVSRARVRIEKPEALAPDAAGAGVEITVVRG